MILCNNKIRELLGFKYEPESIIVDLDVCSLYGNYQYKYYFKYGDYITEITGEEYI